MTKTLSLLSVVMLWAGVLFADARQVQLDSTTLVSSLDQVSPIHDLAELEELVALGVIEPRAACFDNINCPPGSQCINGNCVVGGLCLSDVDCPIGKKCQAGNCK